MLAVLAGLAAACGSTKTTVTVVQTTTMTETVTTDAAPSADSATSTDSSSGSSSPSGDASSGKGRSERRFGGTSIDDGIAFTVLGWSETQQVPQDLGDPAVAPSGAKFVLVRVRWRNNTSSATDPFCGEDGAILVDSHDRNFNPDDSQVGMAGNDICSEMQPGFQRTDTLVFRIPSSAQESSVAVWNSNAESDFGHSSYVIFSP